MSRFLLIGIVLLILYFFVRKWIKKHENQMPHIRFRPGRIHSRHILLARQSQPYHR